MSLFPHRVILNLFQDPLRHLWPVSVARWMLKHVQHDGLIILVAIMAATPAYADSSLPPAPLAYTQLPDPRQEAKAAALMHSLRCLVCQGQSIADSDAEMAGDMRALVRQKIAAGESPDDIRDWLVARYGKWVSYDPPLDVMTAPLWIAPLLLLGIGIWVARGRFRKHR